MNSIAESAVKLGTGGLLLALIELLLPRSGTRTVAKTAIGLLFLQMLAQNISGIFH